MAGRFPGFQTHLKFGKLELLQEYEEALEKATERCASMMRGQNDKLSSIQLQKPYDH